jgi:hypothetical protein
MAATDQDVADVDHRAPADAASSDAPANLVANPSFEDGVGGCGSGWTVDYGTGNRSSALAHTGGSSCLVCTTQGGFYLHRIERVPVAEGQYYYGEAWVHAAPRPTLPADTHPTTAMYFTGPDAEAYLESAVVEPGAGWALVSQTAATPAGVARLQFSVHGSVDDGGCLLVDDVALYQQ